MDNEFDLELDKIEEDSAKEAKVKNRYKELSEKVIQEKAERERAEKEAKEASDRAKSIEKERDFFKDFSATASKYPQATEFQDKIWDKVQGGYATEDAIVAVLHSEGKLGQPEMKPITDGVIGGSAGTTMTDTAKKDLSQMSADDKLAVLLELERKGDIAMM